MFDDPAGCACDAEGNIYIADAGNHRIRKVGPGIHIARHVIR